MFLKSSRLIIASWRKHLRCREIVRMTSTVCDWIPPVVLDSINTCKKYANDTSEDKLDAIFGAYRDENGKPWIQPFIREIEKKIFESPNFNHEYVLFLGLDKFKELAPQLVLGKDSPHLKSGKAYGVQTASGTAAIRAGVELLVRRFKYNTFYLSVPTWDNHEVTFRYGGMSNCCRYRYWDPVKKGLDFKGMIEDLQQAPENAVICLQICSHNPTGCDLSKKQWMEVAEVMKERKLFPFFDAAYQGFGSGCKEKDIWPVRYFVEKGFKMLVAQSFSKNMGLYSERSGCLTVLLDVTQEETEEIKLLLTAIVRSLYLCPTRLGAEILIQTLEDPEMEKRWDEVLQLMVDRVKSVRQGLADRLEKLGTPGNWDHLTNQRGMFSFTGLTTDQVAYLGKKHHIYILPNGRANMCAFNTWNLDRVARAIHDSVVNVPE